jgi:hypothetical protein
VGDTEVPLIFISDRTHLSNIAVEKTERPVYMAIGNLSLKLRQMHSTHSSVMDALLLIPIKIRNIPEKRRDE